MDAFIYYKQKCKVVSLNLAHPVYYSLVSSKHVAFGCHCDCNK